MSNPMYEYIARKLREASFGWPEEDDEFYDLVRFCFDKAKEYERLNAQSKKPIYDTKTNPYMKEEWNHHSGMNPNHYYNKPWKDKDEK